MVCIYCGGKTEIVNSRGKKRLNQTWRRRHCLQCGNTLTTIERYDLAGSIAIEKDGQLSPFIEAKLLISVYKSMAHRRAAAKDASYITDTIISKLFATQKAQMETGQIKQAVYDTLLNFDKAAATTYQAYHE